MSDDLLDILRPPDGVQSTASYAGDDRRTARSANSQLFSTGNLIVDDDRRHGGLRSFAGDNVVGR